MPGNPKTVAPAKAGAQVLRRWPIEEIGSRPAPGVMGASGAHDGLQVND
jgi:hypothetical protein